MRHVYNILSFFLFATVANGARRPRYMVQWHSFDCLNHWPEIRNLSCSIGPEKKLLNCYLELNEPIQQMSVKYTLLVHRRSPRNDTVLLATSFDVCQLLASGVRNNRLVLSVYHNMIKDSNVAKQCPVEKGPLYFHNINLSNDLPGFLPEINFTVTVIFYKPNTADSIDVTVKGSLLELNGVRQNVWH